MANKRDPKHKAHPALARSYWPRSFAYAAGSLLVFAQVPTDNTIAQYVVLGFGFLYPTLFYHLGMRSRNTRFVGFLGYYLDALIWSAAVIYTHYSIVLLLLAPILAAVSSLLMMGIKRAFLPALLMTTILASVWYFELAPFEPFGHLSLPQAIFGWAMLLVFMIYITSLVNGTTRSFVAARHELQEGNAKIKEQSEQLASITYVAQLVNSTLDLDQVLSTVMRSLNQVFSFTMMAILFVDEKREKLVLDRMSGDVSPQLLERLEGLDIPLDEQNSAFTRTVTDAQPVYLADVSKDIGASEGVSKLIYEIVPAKSMLTFPLRQDGAVEGVLVFANTRNYLDLDPSNIKEIGRYVTYIVSAIRNAKNYRAIQDARAAADAANVAKSQFLANMSHELRTPMNAVIGYTEMLQEEAEDRGLDDLVPDFEKIRSASQHLLQLINDVLDLSKIEADRIELSPEVLSVDELISNVSAHVEPLIAKNRNQLKITRRSALGEVFLDRVRLHQVILNLLSNSAKFTRKGTIEVVAERLTEHEHDLLIIKVRDSGIGMTEEQLERVFEPFAQADASTTREFGGTGLGLSISRQICEMMGGSLTATSEKDVGSVFTVCIPVEHTGVRAGALPHAKAADKSVGPVKHVLVIDDDASIRELMTRMLKREGFSVYTASSGEEGLEMAMRIKPSVILLDVMLPRMDGWAVLTKIKSTPELADIPVVMQSILDEANKGFMLGARDYLTKPIDRKRVLSVIGKLQRSDDKRVLVVEDDKDTREIMASWLTQAGWEVSAAVDGQEGLEAWKRTRADLVILDLMMPRMDGFEFMEALRQIPEARETRVVVVTAKHLEPEDLQKLNGSVERIIQKASRPADEIVQEVARHLVQ